MRFDPSFRLYAGVMEPKAKTGSSPSLQERPSEADYDRLAILLDHFEADQAMDLEEMDGFFAALICGPDLVLPSEYLEEIWGGGDAPFENLEELREFLNLAMRHWNWVAGVLADPNQIFEPQLWVNEGEDLPRGNNWALGFMRGMGLRRKSWGEISADEDDFAMLMPILALAHENDTDPEIRTWKTPPDRGLREQLIIGISVATRQLYDYFRARPALEILQKPPGKRPAGRKIGRNDPCYCGSGKKYKRCCGKVTVN
jgi:uncharacterized protein